MKYRLKKDLPFAKAGAEVRVNFLNVVYVTDRQFVENNTTIQYLCESSWLGNLIEQGWIEEVKPKEVKPREFRIVLRNGEPYDYSCPPTIPTDRFETIKVREVIE